MERAHLPPFWISSGIMLAVLLRSDFREWPAYILAGIALSILGQLINGFSPITVAGFAIAGVIEILVVAVILRRRFAIADLRNMRHIGAFLIVVAALGMPFGAIMGGAVHHWVTGAPYWYSVLEWWTAHAIGAMVITPVLLT